MKIHTSINEFLANSTKTAPSRPAVTPGTRPGTRPSPSPIRRDKPSVSPNPKAEQPTIKPKTSPGIAPTKPGTRPSPSPIRRTRPSVKPNPKAETDFQTATEEDILSRFVQELREKGGTIRINKKYKR